MKPGWAAVLLIGFSIVITLLAAGIIMMVSSRPRGEPIPLIAPPTPPLLVVQVSGAVANPGVYHLPAGGWGLVAFSRCYPDQPGDAPAG